MDNKTPKQRSLNMSRIKRRNTKPELKVRKYLHAQGLRYRLNKPKLPGKPDIIFNKYKTVVFIDGCFWHRHKGCKYSYNPKTRVDFWQEKFEKNIIRAKTVNRELGKLSWKIIRIWECEINDRLLNTIVKKIRII